MNHTCPACQRTFRTAQGLGLHFDHARKGRGGCAGPTPAQDAAVAVAEAKVERVFAQAEANNPQLVRDANGAYRARDPEERRAVTNIAVRIVTGMAERGAIDPDNDHEIQAAMRRAVPLAFTAYRAAIDFVFG